MRIQELAANNLQATGQMLEMTLADFTDAELLVRPVHAANHAAWQLGHLLVSETMFIASAGGQAVALPPEFAERFNGQTTGENEAAKLASKAELLGLWKKVRAASIAWVKSLADADLDKASPESVRAWVATFGDMAMGISMHSTMHLGQLQVIRRKLGKPILF